MDKENTDSCTCLLRNSDGHCQELVEQVKCKYSISNLSIAGKLVQPV